MATGTFTVVTTDPGPFADIGATFYLALGNIEILSDQTATGFTGYDLVNDLAIDFAGTALTYNAATGKVTGGTATGYTLRSVDGRLVVGSFEPGTKALDVLKAGDAFLASGLTDASKLDAIFGTYAYSFQGNAGGETLTGNKLADTLIGGGGNDTLNGGDGNDVLIGGLGDDILNGGKGIDTASYADSAAPVQLDLSLTGGQDTVGAGKDTLSQIQNLIGGLAGDKLSGDANANMIDGGEDDDIITGGAGADMLDGGNGIDTLNYALLPATQSVTVTLGAPGALATISATTGSDPVGDKAKNFENVTGGAGNDKLTGNADENVLDGGDGDDFIEGGPGNDTLIGGNGIDTLSYSTSSTGLTVIFGSFGFGHIGISDAGFDSADSFENLIGSAKDDNVRGLGSDVNKIDGGGGNDEIEGGEKGDTLIGGTGVNTLSYQNETDPVTVTLVLNKAADVSGAGNVGTDAENDVATGFQNLRGGAGSDVLTGDSKDNVIEGGKGADKLFGGGGNDTVSYKNAGSFGVTVVLSVTKQDSLSDAKDDELTGFRHIIGSNSMNGDVLVGDKNANTIFGGGGGDLIVGGGGPDILDGGDGLDTVSYLEWAGDSKIGVTVTLGAKDVQTLVSATPGSDGVGDKIKNFENVTGGIGNDVLTGNADGNNIYGMYGDDLIVGGAGADLLEGDPSPDFIFHDTLSYAASAAGVTVNFMTESGSGGDAEGDVILRFEDLIGSAKDDRLIGSDAVNKIDGGAGNDEVEGGASADTLIGGTNGTVGDALSYAADTDPVAIALVFSKAADVSAAGNAGTDAEGDVATGFENLRGGQGTDKLTGDSKNNVIEGGPGADVLNGGGGIDTLSYEHSDSASGIQVALGAGGAIDSSGASSGTDVVGDSGSGFANIVGSRFIDWIIGNDVANMLSGGKGGDLLEGQAGNDTLLGEGGEDILIGGKDVDTIDGGSDNDIVDGGPGADILDGGTDDRDALNYAALGAAVTVTLTLGEPNVQKTVMATAGSDAAGDKIKNFEWYMGGASKDVVTGNSLANILEGGGGNDIFNGGGGNDEIVGDAGDDTIQGGAGGDTLDGGSGGEVNGDTLSYASSTGGVLVDIGANTAISGDAHGDTIAEFENLIGSGKDDELSGTAGKNSISGGNGNDLISGGGGADTLDGALGTDWVSYWSSAAGVTVDLTVQATKGVQSGGDAAGDVLTGFENLGGSPLADQLSGDGGNNTIFGGEGHDTINGGKGNDIIFADAGDDTVDGGDGNDVIRGDNGIIAGNDTLVGGNGTDTLSYQLSTGGVTVNLSVTGLQDTKGSGKDTVSGFENLIGSAAFDDKLVGDSEVNTIEGLAGADTIAGGGAADVLDGGDDIDTLDYSALTAGQSATVKLGASGAETTVTATAGSDAVGDKIRNFENVTGSAGNDVLTGNALVNKISGDAGDDTIQGGGSGDTLDGGTGGETKGDTLTYALSALGVNVSLNPSASGGDSEGDTISNFENLIGTAKNDMLFGTAGVNKIDGGDGDDIIEGRDGGDTLIGGKGNDTLSYAGDLSGVTVTLIASKAADVAAGNSGTDAENDVATGFENLIGGQGPDQLTGDSGNNIIEGGDDADKLDGGGGVGVNTLSYASDKQGVTINFASKTASGSHAGGDAINFATFTHIIGGSGNDVLTGSSASNKLFGMLGDDLLAFGTGGNDTFDGGDGFDRASVSGAIAAATIDLAAGTIKVGAATHTLISIEFVTGGTLADKYSALGFGATSKNAGSTGIANHLGLFNQFEGMEGNDTILGNGATRISYFNADAAVSVDLQTGKAQSLVADDAHVGVDSILGGVNSVRGGLFNDVLKGSDVIDVENFEGRGGNDTIDGRGGFDRANYMFQTNAITVDLSAGNTGTVLGGASADTDTLSNVEAIRGTDFADKYDATGYTNEFASFNEFEGEDGNDTIIGNGNTRISFVHSATGVTVDLTTGKAQGDGSKSDNVGVDTWTVDTVHGVRGSEFNDTIIGFEGDDRLDGGLGNDTLTGGGDHDTFVYSIGVEGRTSGGGADKITDFFVEVDTIDLAGVPGMLGYADVKAKMTEVGPDVVIDFGGGNTLTIVTDTIAHLDANQGVFLFA